MRRVTYQYEKMSGSRHVGWLNATGWFHKFVTIREDRTDEVYALVETKTGEIEMVLIRHVTFSDRPKTSEE